MNNFIDISYISGLNYNNAIPNKFVYDNIDLYINDNNDLKELNLDELFNKCIEYLKENTTKKDKNKDDYNININILNILEEIKEFKVNNPSLQDNKVLIDDFISNEKNYIKLISNFFYSKDDVIEYLNNNNLNKLKVYKNFSLSNYNYDSLNTSLIRLYLLPYIKENYIINNKSSYNLNKKSVDSLFNELDNQIVKELLLVIVKDKLFYKKDINNKNKLTSFLTKRFDLLDDNKLILLNHELCSSNIIDKLKYKKILFDNLCYNFIRYNKNTHINIISNNDKNHDNSLLNINNIYKKNKNIIDNESLYLFGLVNILNLKKYNLEYLIKDKDMYSFINKNISKIELNNNLIQYIKLIDNKQNQRKLLEKILLSKNTNMYNNLNNDIFNNIKDILTLPMLNNIIANNVNISETNIMSLNKDLLNNFSSDANSKLLIKSLKDKKDNNINYYTNILKEFFSKEENFIEYKNFLIKKKLSNLTNMYIWILKDKNELELSLYMPEYILNNKDKLLELVETKNTYLINNKLNIILKDDIDYLNKLVNNNITYENFPKEIKHYLNNKYIENNDEENLNILRTLIEKNLLIDNMNDKTILTKKIIRRNKI